MSFKFTVNVIVPKIFKKFITDDVIPIKVSTSTITISATIGVIVSIIKWWLNIF